MKTIRGLLKSEEKKKEEDGLSQFLIQFQIHPPNEEMEPNRRNRSGYFCLQEDHREKTNFKGLFWRETELKLENRNMDALF